MLGPGRVVPAANGAASGFLRIGLADRSPSRLFEITRTLAQLGKGLQLDFADPVGRQRELLAEFLEGATGVRTDSEAPSQHNLLAWAQDTENLPRPFPNSAQASLPPPS